MASLGWTWPSLIVRSDVVAVGMLLAVATFYNFYFTIRYPRNLARVGRKPGQTGFTLRTRWQYYTDCESLYREAYENYSKQGKTVLIPGLGCRDEIVLPFSAIQWLIEQPEGTLSVSQALVEIEQVTYSLGSQRFAADARPIPLVKRDMDQVMEARGDALKEELAVAFDTLLGDDTQSWREIDLYKTVETVIAQVATYFTLGSSVEGLQLCRNEEYHESCLAAIDGLLLNAGITGASPNFLKPVVGRLASLPLSRNIAKLGRHVRPLYEERMRLLHRNKEDPDVPMPQDHYQMMLRYAAEHMPEELNPDDMCRRLCVANFGLIHLPRVQLTNMILDILGSDAEFDTVAVLRDEIARVIGAAPDGTWTKAKAAAMSRIDSVARETLRTHSFANRTVPRKVLVDGLVTEDGVSLPKGAMVSLFNRGPQTDAEHLEEPCKYDPFRFSRLREAASDAEGRPGLGSLSFTSTSKQYLPFGHGKTACPGRFIVDFELKMITSYLLMHYDICFPPENEGRRPPNIWLLETLVPPPGVKIMVKKRLGVSSGDATQAPDGESRV
ncbi:hypothetical protein JDV02_000299 [Purpureocillium takamizusanense]|uniref:Cytochrome P450 n=1 Tax=Purpureocillium takamizusanense TaxID=2060973 RepID=A0A9Q8Q4J1_9HYPO|nr:uncharacterized protein JDV02_000299 [Purpureocillium takamizusanense]UNI13569.1 hypothetical protein JDV02_000299 [Purpureocillium takamizusanense]